VKEEALSLLAVRKKRSSPWRAVSLSISGVSTPGRCSAQQLG
jgi:hypothetical protein